MSLIGYVRAFFAWLWKSKFRFALAVASAVMFALFIFPYDDLADLVSSRVAAASNNTLFLQFERLRMSLFPQPGMQLNQVYVETVSMPGLSVQELTITPSVSALFARKPYGHVVAKGLLKGDVSLKVGSGGTSEKGAELTRLEVQAKKLSLQDIRQMAKLPVLLKGKIDLDTKGEIDLAFTDQPTIDVDLKISQFEMPPSNVQTQLGDLTLPEMKLSGIDLKGKLSQGRFLIESAKLGAPGDDLQGTLKGTFNVNLQQGPAGLVPIFGAYSLEVELQPSPSFKSRAGFILTLLSDFQSGDKYHFKLSAESLQGPPRMNRMQ